MTGTTAAFASSTTIHLRNAPLFHSTLVLKWLIWANPIRRRYRDALICPSKKFNATVPRQQTGTLWRVHSARSILRKDQFLHKRTKSCWTDPSRKFLPRKGLRNPKSEGYSDNSFYTFWPSTWWRRLQSDSKRLNYYVPIAEGYRHISKDEYQLREGNSIDFRKQIRLKPLKEPYKMVVQNDEDLPYVASCSKSRSSRTNLCLY